MKVIYVESNKTWVVECRFSEESIARRIANMLENQGCKRVVVVPSPFNVVGKSNQQSSRVNNKPDHVKATIAIDSSQLVESIKEFKQSLGHKTTLPTVYASKEKPTNPHIGDLWISSYSKYERDGIIVSASYKQWDGREWTPYHG